MKRVFYLLLFLCFIIWALIIMVRSPSAKKNESKRNDWRLIWSDEFEGNRIDENKWAFQNGDGSEFGMPGWGNQELQYYRPENTLVADSTLTITAKYEKDGYEGASYTSSKLVTQGLFSQKYGKFEAKIKLPVGEGFWPAFWMLPENSPYGKWASCGEIDIIEAKGRLIHRVSGAIHFGEVWPNNHFSSGHCDLGQESIAEYHVYAVEWQPGEIKWSMDDQVYFTETNWYSKGEFEESNYPFPAPFDQPFYLILNLAVGGTYDEFKEPISQEIYSGEMVIDYVRVYIKDEIY